MSVTVWELGAAWELGALLGARLRLPSVMIKQPKAVPL